MSKKVNLVTLFFIIIIILAFGIGIGYLITTNINKDQILKESNVKNETIQTEQKTQVEQKLVELPKYDGSKYITVNNKTYTVSYKKEYDDEEQIFNTTIYVNDKKLKTYPYYHTFDNNNLELTTIVGDTEYIVIAVNTFAPSDENVYLLIINQEEELIDTVQVHLQSYGISVNDINDIKGTYKIYDDNIVFFKYIGCPITKDGSKYYVAVYKITVEKNNTIYSLERLCTSDEVTFIGK